MLKRRSPMTRIDSSSLVGARKSTGSGSGSGSGSADNASWARSSGPVDAATNAASGSDNSSPSWSSAARGAKASSGRSGKGSARCSDGGASRARDSSSSKAASTAASRLASSRVLADNGGLTGPASASNGKSSSKWG